jgi:O-antigen/teichoic acid export membrane protein
VLPLALSLLTVPLYLGKIGPARYGIVALIWLLFGYFGLFDFGLSKATANRLARPENQTRERQAELFWTALVINTFLGMLGGMAFWLLADPILTTFNSIPADLHAELRAAMPWVACLVPLSTTSAVFTGALEAHERFFALNLTQLVGASLIQVAPLLAIYQFGTSIQVVIGATALTRLLATTPIAALSLKQVGRHWQTGFKLATIKDLFAYGSWVTTTNIFGPLLVSVDQFMIGSAFGVQVVPQYSIPFNFATKVLIMPIALVRALFPQISKLNQEDALRRAELVARTTSLVLALVCVPGIFMAEYGLNLWLGRDFAGKAATVLRILLFGVWVNGVAFIPFALLQSQSRPDLPAKFHALELLPFMAILWLLLHAFGLPGAAVAWLLRVAVDAGLLFWAAGFSAGLIRKILFPLAALASALAITTLLPLGTLPSAALATCAFAALAMYSYSFDATIKRLCYQVALAYSST